MRNSSVLFVVVLFACLCLSHSVEAKTWDPAKGLLLKNSVWSLGMGTVGGHFNKFGRIQQVPNMFKAWGQSGKKNGALMFRHEATKSMEPGLTLQPGKLYLHPGAAPAHLTILRFTAPADGTYKFKAKWTSAHTKGDKSWSWVHTNAKSAKGTVYKFTPKGFKEIFTKGLSAPGKSTSWNGTLKLKKGEVVDFHAGRGGDTFKKDWLQLQLTVTQ